MMTMTMIQIEMMSMKMNSLTMITMIMKAEVEVLEEDHLIEVDQTIHQVLLIIIRRRLQNRMVVTIIQEDLERMKVGNIMNRELTQVRIVVVVVVAIMVLKEAQERDTEAVE